MKNTPPFDEDLGFANSVSVFTCTLYHCVIALLQ